MNIRIPSKFELFKEKVSRFLLSDICNRFGICCYCLRRKATWHYMPSWYTACDECVPRGCSCNEYPADDDYDNTSPDNMIEDVDELGRKYPCCEWWRIE